MYKYPHSWLDGPLAPGPSPDEIENLTDRTITNKKNLGLKEPVAAKLAIEALEKVPPRQVFWAAGRYGPCTANPFVRRGLALRIFHQLDKELFRGVLKGRVFVGLSTDTASSMHGVTHSATGPYLRVSILLDGRALARDPPEVVLAILIHHMVHAYFLVCCGYGGEDGKHDLKHGLPYSTLIWQISMHFQGSLRYSMPNLFRCTDDLSRHLQRRSVNFALGEQSYCYWASADFKSYDECLRYGMDTLRSLKVPDAAKNSKGDGDPASFPIEDEHPRSEYLYIYRDSLGTVGDHVSRSDYNRLVPPSLYIELHYQGKAIPISSSLLQRHPKFHSKLLDKDDGGKVITVPGNVSSKTFTEFIHFLSGTAYKPSYSANYRPKSLPKIETSSPDDENDKKSQGPDPSLDLRMYTLASHLSFPELRKYALGRLYSLQSLNSDPMDFIEEVYSAKPPGEKADAAIPKWKPDKELRSFVVDFLCVEHSPTADLEPSITFSWTPHGLAPQEKKKKTNLSILKGQKHNSRFSKLRSGGSGFLEDVDKAEEKLKKGSKPKIPDGLCAGLGLSGCGHSAAASAGVAALIAPEELRSEAQKAIQQRAQLELAMNGVLSPETSLALANVMTPNRTAPECGFSCGHGSSCRGGLLAGRGCALGCGAGCVGSAPCCRTGSDDQERRMRGLAEAFAGMGFGRGRGCCGR